jgi:TfoX/Sxy family transcriptional regulator of competence genes
MLRKHTEFNGQSLVVFQGEEWSALYIDGELDTVGDSYLVDERIASLVKVQYRDGGESFLINYDTVPHSLDEAQRIVDEGVDLSGAAQKELAEAQRKLAEAQELVRQAEAFARGER